ncbi:MAG: hypothetical protein ACRDJV_13520 [Actinomycetota bacterium]
MENASTEHSQAGGNDPPAEPPTMNDLIRSGAARRREDVRKLRLFGDQGPDNRSQQEGDK